MPSGKIDRRQLLTGGTVLTLAGLAGATSTSAAEVRYDLPRSGKAALYSRAELEGFIDRYLAALVAHDPKLAPFASDVIFAENDVRLPLGSASWKTIERLGRYRHYFADPQNGDAGLIATVYENGKGAILVLRLKIRDRQIVEAEQCVTRDAGGAETYEKLGAPDPVWLEAVPEAQRQSHDALRAAAFTYFEALQRNDGAGIYPFRDDAVRIEHARRVTSLPAVEGYGHADAAFNFTTLSAKAQYEMGMMAFVSEIRDRRYQVVDVERGAVLATSFFDYHGDLKSITFADGRHWPLPAYFRTPRSNHANEAFKVINGSFRYIEMTFVDVPFATRAVWSGPKPTVTLEYDPPPPRVAALKSTSRAELTDLAGRVLDGLVRHCACDLPLAANCRYTENGIDVAPGAGLWRSATGLRDYRIVLADADRGEVAWFGAINEHGLFTMMALRLRVVGGYIAEIETIVARPEKPAQGEQLREATFTLFVPPLGADLDPAAFQAPAAPLMRAAAASRADIQTAVDSYQDACAQRNARLAQLSPNAIRRDNGHAAGDLARSPMAALTRMRGRRSLIVDADQGLALEVVLRDNPATSRSSPAEFLAPWTDLHAQLFKVEQGRIAHVEELVKRLPYGHESGWGPAASV
jgi:hypothetical protein